MPLNEKGQEILSSMEKTYGSPEKAESVLYASKNAGTVTGIDQTAMPAPPMTASPPPASDEPEEDCGPTGHDEAAVGPLEPQPEFEHPQLHPAASTPPEPATGDDLGFGMRDAGVGYGGVSGGVIQQEWGDGVLVPDQLPQGGMSISDIRRVNEQFWPQWKGTE